MVRHDYFGRNNHILLLYSKFLDIRMFTFSCYKYVLVHLFCVVKLYNSINFNLLAILL